jgi:hypothetical protein
MALGEKIMSLVKSTQCNKCKLIIPEEKIAIKNLVVVTGKRTRALAEESLNELAIEERVDLCSDCCLEILRDTIYGWDNTVEHMYLAEFLKEYIDIGRHK